MGDTAVQRGCESVCKELTDGNDVLRLYDNGRKKKTVQGKEGTMGEAETVREETE